MSKPDFRLDHTMIRVFDQDKTLDFYTRILGMKILRQNEYPDGRFTNTFVGYQGEDDGTTIEMTYNWDQQEPYDFGNDDRLEIVQRPQHRNAMDLASDASAFFVQRGNDLIGRARIALGFANEQLRFVSRRSVEKSVKLARVAEEVAETFGVRRGRADDFLRIHR